MTFSNHKNMFTAKTTPEQYQMTSLQHRHMNILFIENRIVTKANNKNITILKIRSKVTRKTSEVRLDKISHVTYCYSIFLFGC